jgi:phosphohistidine phosphatase
MVVMRHAQARPADTGEGDHERRLTDHGRRDARRVGERLVALGWLPVRVLCSDAARTVETWSRMVDRFPDVREVLTTPKMYGAGSGALVELLRVQPEEASSLLLVGHNPGLEELVSELSGRLVALGTANAALLERSGAPSWRESLHCGSWRLVEIVSPKEAPVPDPGR